MRMHKTYEINCALEPQAAAARIETLLADAGVRFNAADLRIISTSTPIVLLGMQPKLYTRKNWVGLNPFVFITGVDVRCEPAAGSATKVNVRVNRRRSILLVAFWAICGYLVARALPQPAGAVVFAIVIFAAWFGIVAFLGGYVVKKEIRDGLRV
jgi:hypothetical protein